MKVAMGDIIGGDKPEPLAVVGFAFEFPDDATTVESFWQMICEGRSASTDFPQDRLNIDAYYHPGGNRPASFPLRGGHFVRENPGAFDAPFFSITPGEAACIDPQHRRLLEIAYHALEDAGLPMSTCIGSDTSVFTGCFTNDYASILQQDLMNEQRHAVMGVASSMLANRVSWFFDFKGTSMNLDSACSSSLVALHLACQDLRARNCSMALVGGANLVYHPNFMKMMSDLNFLAKDSRSWSFDDRANGYARGEGHAVVVIKRLSDALKAGDTIRAVIRNTGSNQDGHTPVITQPSGDAQGRLIKRTHEQAGIDMSQTRFFEAHGTGTPVGDPIEANAIGRAFRGYRSQDDPLYIGSVKANIGHLEGCSGLAGLIKTILILERGIIPPIAGLKSLNPNISAENLGLHFPTTTTPWPVPTLRRACVNSFGFGGTNATVIVDDAYHFLHLHGLQGLHRTQRAAPSGYCNGTNGMTDSEHLAASQPRLLVWSAPDQQGAQRLFDTYQPFLKSQAPKDIENVSYTLAERRSRFAWRTYVVTGPAEVPCVGQVTSSKPVKIMGDVRIAFVFTGQGAQYQGMGRQLLCYPVFLESINTSEKYLKSLGCIWSLTEVLAGYGEIDINNPEYSQTLTTCLQIALVDLLRSFNISPSVVLGHSSGEIAAAYACGALPHLSAIKVTYYRGVLSARLSEDLADLNLTMMAVGTSRKNIQIYLDQLRDELDTNHDIQIACVNSPRSITLTGPWDQLSRIEQALRNQGIFARRLRVPIAYHHSSFMSKITDKYIAALGNILESGEDQAVSDQAQHSTVPLISSVIGDVASRSILITGQYWARNLVSTVDFEAAFVKLALNVDKKPRQRLGKTQDVDLRATHVFEIGPHSVLQGPIRDTLHDIGTSKSKSPSLLYLSSLVRNQHAISTLLQAVGQLWCSGLSSILLPRVNNLVEVRSPTTAGMPPYPFDHTQIYWNESRLSKNLRFPEAPRHDLLGIRSLDWNPKVAQWRNVIRLTEVPWLQDHTIRGQIIFPAAGMVAMAIEATRQLVDKSTSLLGLYLNDVNFSHAIAFPAEEEKVETQITLSRSNDEKHNVTCQFRLFALENGTYIECCSGSVRAVTERLDQDRIVAKGPWTGDRSFSDWWSQISKACEGSHQDLYSSQQPHMIHYGPSFQNLESPQFGPGGEAVARLNTQSWKTRCADGGIWPRYPVHPTTLDGLAQLLVPAFVSRRGAAYLPTILPTRIDNLWIEWSPRLRDGRLDVAAEVRTRGYRGAQGSIVVSAGSSNPLIILNGLEATFVGSTADQMAQDTDGHPPLCHRIVSKPDIALMTPEELSGFLTRERPRQPAHEVESYYQKMTSTMASIYEGVEFLDQNPALKLNEHVEPYVHWMRYQVQLTKDGKSLIDHATVQGLLEDPDRRQRNVREIEAMDSEGKLLMILGRHLNNILCGKIDPIVMIVQDQLLDHYYAQMIANDHHAYPICEALDLLTHQNPSMKILEVGAGTGSITPRLLEAMTSNGVRRWLQYDFTDVSPSFLDSARTKFAKFTNSMNFRLCDISTDPTVQSFEPESYDLIVASHVMHTTRNLHESLSNVRKLLKPGGKLILLETTVTDTIEIGFIFGLLKDWWAPLKKETRSLHSPCLAPTEWDSALKKAGFSGIDVDIPGQAEVSTRYSSIIISTAVSPASSPPDVRVIIDESVKSQSTISLLLRTECWAKSYDVWDLATLAAAELSKETVVVFMLEIDSALLADINESKYEILNVALQRCKTVLWATRSSEPDDPRHHIVDGLGRVLNSEDSTYKFSVLQLDGQRDDQYRAARAISNLVQRTFQHPVENVDNVVSSGGVFQTLRIIENRLMDAVVAQATDSRQIRACFVDSTPLALHIRSPRQLGTLEWRACDSTEEYDRPLGQNEVLVTTRAIGLSHQDYAIVMGQLDETAIGIEFAGVVAAAGEGSGFLPGERVFSVVPFSSTCIMRVKAEMLARIPPDVSFAVAASLPGTLLLVYHSIINVAHLQPNETILIHEGASCAGQIAIQLAKHIGARVLVTTNTDVDVELLRSDLCISPDDMFSLQDPTLEDSILQRTTGDGVDVVIGSLDEEKYFDFARCLAPFGRLVNAGFALKAEPTKMMATSSYPTNITRASVSLIDFLKSRARLAYSTLREAAKIVLGHSFILPQFRIFGSTSIEEAFVHLSMREMIGKGVIELSPGSTVMANVRMRQKTLFSADASYVVAGGFGGLGRGILRWMVSRGARNLIILSRSGARSDTARALISELEAQGAMVATPMVDVSNMTALRQTLDEIREIMPPIRGCIQATVALRDNFWPKMSFDDWHISLSSKATGSWNLHSVLPSGIDFFILMSSINGLFGNRGQANYAAGNTYKDALAHYRIQKKQKAISIDLGLMVDEGMVAGDEKLLAGMRRMGHLIDIRMEELLALLEFYCNVDLPVLSHGQAQILTGIETPAAVLAKGLDLHHSIHRPIFSHLFAIGRDSRTQGLVSGLGSIELNHSSMLRNAESEDEAAELVTDWVRAKMSQVLGLKVDDIDLSRPAHTYGIDSLVSIDLKNWFEREIGAEVQVFTLLGNTPLRDLGRIAASKSSFRSSI